MSLILFIEQIKRSQSEKGGDRLQSLISKYRGYSDAGSQPERKIKPLSLSPSSKMGLVTKGRSFGPAAPKTEKEVSGEVTDCSVQESHFPKLTSSHFAKSESSAHESSPILQEYSAKEIEVPVKESVESAKQMSELDGAFEEGRDGEKGTEGEEKAIEDEAEDDEESDEEESDSEQRDIDKLIDR